MASSIENKNGHDILAAATSAALEAGVARIFADPHLLETISIQQLNDDYKMTPEQTSAMRDFVSKYVLLAAGSDEEEQIPLDGHLLELIFLLYDAFLFGGTLSAYLNESGIALSFVIKGKCGESSDTLAQTRTAYDKQDNVNSMSLCLRKTWRRSMTNDFVERFYGNESREKRTQLSDLLRVFEHEFAHVLLRLFDKNTGNNRHDKAFTLLVNGLFQHKY